MEDHPCFTCKLPDCDDANSKCNLRKAATQYRTTKRNNMPIPDTLRRHYNIAYRELYGDQRKVRRGGNLTDVTKVG